MLRTSARARALVAIIAIAFASLAFGSAPAQAASSYSRCLLVVRGVDSAGIFKTDAMQCFSSDAAAEKWRKSKGKSAQFTLGYHYLGSNYTGSLMQIVGNDCLGGELNTPTAYRQPGFESTINGCPVIAHYYLLNNAGNKYDSQGAIGAYPSPYFNHVYSFKYKTTV